MTTHKPIFLFKSPTEPDYWSTDREPQPTYFITEIWREWCSYHGHFITQPAS